MKIDLSNVNSIKNINAPYQFFTIDEYIKHYKPRYVKTIKNEPWFCVYTYIGYVSTDPKDWNIKTTTC